MRGFGTTASLFQGGTLKNATHASPGNSVEFNQSDDEFETPEVFLILCAICMTFSQQSVGMTPEAETMHLTMTSTLATLYCQKYWVAPF